jgi:hypothetical protein
MVAPAPAFAEHSAGHFVVVVCFVLKSFLAAPLTQTLILDDARRREG